MQQTVREDMAFLVQRFKDKSVVLAQRIDRYEKLFVKSIKANGLKVLPVVSFAIPILLLYWMYPSTFEPVWTGTWKNRMYYLFFVWILVLETILGWKELKAHKLSLRSVKSAVLVVAFLLPTIYVILSNYAGLNGLIVTLARNNNVGEAWAELMPLSTEYLVFAVLLAFMIVAVSSRHGLKSYLISTSFLALVGAIYTIDNLYPFGTFTPFQLLVVPTATCASFFLTLMGYPNSLNTQGGMPVLTPTSSSGAIPSFQISWPCSGVESLLIYSVVILLFLRRSGVPPAHKIVYFVVGAIVTFFINILRITTLIVIAVNGGDWGIFHDYYGALYSITWIICYPLIIIGTQILSERIRSWRMNTARPDGYLPSSRGL